MSDCEREGSQSKGQQPNSRSKDFKYVYSD